MKKRELLGLHCAGFLGWIDSTEATARRCLPDFAWDKEGLRILRSSKKDGNYAETNNG
jgi:hypothetical protein